MFNRAMCYSDEAKAMYDRVEALLLKLIERVKDFQHTYDNWDPVWSIPFEDRKKHWNAMHVSFYRGVYYVSCWMTNAIWHDYWQWKIKLGEFCQEDENSLRDCVFPDAEVIEDALTWLDAVKKDWLGMYRKLEREWPKNYREGTIARAIVERYVPKFPRPRELAGEVDAKYFCELVESHYYEREEKFCMKEMTAGKYLELVGIGLGATVDANRIKGKKMSGADYYSMNGYNGSSGTILKVPRDSPEEFDKWLHEKEPYGWHDGGHQFWIGPGRIHLSVRDLRDEFAKKEGYEIDLSACFAWTAYNLVKMAVAYHKAGVHVKLGDAKKIRDVLLAQDRIHVTQRGGETRYSDREECFESVELSDFGSRYVNLKDYIQWEPLPILRPKVLDYNPIQKEENW